MLIEASQTEEHRNHHSVLCMRHSVRNILVAGVSVWSMWRNAFKTWWSELHKSINLHITRTATVTLWELVSWTEFYGLQCSSFSVDRTLQLSIKLQSTTCRGGSSQRRVFTWGWSRVAVSWCGKVVTRCLARAGRTGDGALGAVAQSASSPHSSLLTM